MIDRVDRNVQRLLHMIEGIKRLKGIFANVSKADFLEDMRLQDASAFESPLSAKRPLAFRKSFSRRILKYHG